MKELKLRLGGEEYEKFADTAYARGRMKHQQALFEAVRLWVKASPTESGQEGAAPPSPTIAPSTGNSPVAKFSYIPGKPTGVESPQGQIAKVSSEEFNAIIQLLRVLRHGPTQGKDALLQNIAAFALLTDYAQGVTSGAIAGDAEGLLAGVAEIRHGDPASGQGAARPPDEAEITLLQIVDSVSAERKAEFVEILSILKNPKDRAAKALETSVKAALNERRTKPKTTKQSPVDQRPKSKVG